MAGQKNIAGMIAIGEVTRKRSATLHCLGSALVAVLSVIVTLPVLQDYIPWSSANFIIGCISLPLLLRGGNAGKSSRRFSVVALAFCIIYIFLPVKTCLYVALISALLGLWESRRGKTSALPPLTLLLMSPVAASFADTFSFPIRLKLTSAAAAVLSLIGTKSAAAGNVISYGGADFSVDPACMGLHMLVTSLLCTMLLIALQQQRAEKIIAGKWVAALLCITFALNLIANVLRIVILVYFHLLPDNPMHEITGLLCLGIYVLIPVHRLIILFLKRSPKQVMQKTPHPLLSAKTRALQAGVLVALTTCTFAIQKSAAGLRGALPQLPGYEASWYDADIARLKSLHALIYIKQLKGFYFTEHNPMLCWVGSGYQFSKVACVQKGGLSYCTGILQKGTERLYTAWWYDDGQDRSNDMTWRLKALNSRNDFSLVNVTADNAQALDTELLKLAASKPLHDWLMRSKTAKEP